MIAALYIDPRGPYASMPGVDPWDETRDATKYPGPWPVVVHPPCGPWGKLKAFCRLQDRALAPLAVDQVRKWGGILEHPVGSGLWPHCRLPRPGWLPDQWGGFTIEVEQCRWGHRAEKKTWLYMAGVDPYQITLPSYQEPTHMAWQGSRNTAGRKPTLWSAERRLTPPAFAQWLVDLARTVKR